ncbi:hypothetical protein AVEN_219605-1 [Araneus ventricosus]|uniref:Uncharacterized protein n=1 Tax=Araneus ventricosus TaxID=182803 RepID=A0A4Y2ULN4_ARAVE|nr:hypothetical protein AVEN_219605-1 [Araneus ventricosus]
MVKVTICIKQCLWKPSGESQEGAKYLNTQFLNQWKGSSEAIHLFFGFLHLRISLPRFLSVGTCEKHRPLIHLGDDNATEVCDTYRHSKSKMSYIKNSIGFKSTSLLYPFTSPTDAKLPMPKRQDGC